MYTCANKLLTPLRHLSFTTSKFFEVNIMVFPCSLRLVCAPVVLSS